MASDTEPRTKLVMNMLEKPISMSFNEDTPLEDVLKYVSASTKSDNSPGIEIYVNPKGLQEAEKSMTSTVRNLDLEGVPLKTTLRLLLRQLDLGCVVKNGVLVIDSLERIQPKTKEPADAVGVGDDTEPQKTQDNPDEPAKARELGKDAKKAGFEPLFNGKDLAGWKVNPHVPVQWEVAGGVIHTNSNGRIYTERDDYTDFELRVELMATPDCLGSVFFRSAISPHRDEHHNVPTKHSGVES